MTTSKQPTRHNATAGALLNVLLDSDHPLTVQTLAGSCRQQPHAIIQQLDDLTAAGCQLERHPQHGIRLTKTGIGVWKDYLLARTETSRIIEVYSETSSTQDVARRLLLAHNPDSCHGAIIITDYQSAGRGRLGRQWLARPGTALTFSNIRLFDAGPEQAASTRIINHLTFITSVAVARALDTFLTTRHLKSTIKWPNDIHIDGKKAGGILVETCRTQSGQTAAIIGIGINIAMTASDIAACWPDEPGMQQAVTSLALHHIYADRLKVLAASVQSLDDVLNHEDPPALLAEWRTRSSSIHQHVKLQSGNQLFEGQVLDLDPNEGLIIRNHSDGTIIHLPAETTTIIP